MESREPEVSSEEAGIREMSVSELMASTDHVIFVAAFMGTLNQSGGAITQLSVEELKTTWAGEWCDFALLLAKERAFGCCIEDGIWYAPRW